MAVRGTRVSAGIAISPFADKSFPQVAHRFSIKQSFKKVSWS